MALSDAAATLAAELRGWRNNEEQAEVAVRAAEAEMDRALERADQISDRERREAAKRAEAEAEALAMQEMLEVGSPCTCLHLAPLLHVAQPHPTTPSSRLTNTSNSSAFTAARRPLRLHHRLAPPLSPRQVQNQMVAQQRRDLEQQKLELEDELAKANRRANKAKQMAAAAIGEL